MTNIKHFSNLFTFTIGFAWVLIFGSYSAYADYEIEIRLADKTVIRKDASLKIVFDYKEEAIFLVDNRPGYLDTTTISPCDLAGLVINPCDTIPLTSVEVREIVGENRISSYPSPAVDNMTVKITSPLYSMAKVSIVGMDGKTVKNFGIIELFQGENLIIWNTSAENVVSGNYIIVVESAHGISTTTQIIVK